MDKASLSKPVLICLYGFPGSGKSYIARHLTDAVEIANVSADRIRSELFESPRYDSQENAIVAHLMNYMTDEFLRNKVSVIYDANALRVSQRRKLRELAIKNKADYLLVWLQIDPDSAFSRTQDRDRRTADDKCAQPYTKLTFDKHLSGMQNPHGEDYLVISGKHAFITQKGTIVNKLYQMGLLSSLTVQSNLAKPGLVNLVPNPQVGHIDFSRRNITIS